MECDLLIAAGGGGDAIAAAIVHRALDGRGGRPAVATYSWDRLLIDPLPGPRDPSSFTALESLGRLNYRVTAGTAPIPPAGSTLPRLAGELDADLYLLDPRRGATGLAEQLAELRDLLGATKVTIVDVGGDILAHGDEPTLRSPLADSLVLAAVAHLDRTNVFITGPGIDGELPEELVLARYEQLGAERVHRLSPEDVEPFRPIFDWHPSEATGLLCAAAAGARGIAEIRDQGFRVVLSDRTPEIRKLPAQRVAAHNHLTAQLTNTTSLDEVEAALRSAGRESEIDYERHKAATGNSSRATLSESMTISEARFTDQLVQIRDDAADRGTDFITLRGLAERLGISGAGLPDLQRRLASRQLGDYNAPLWTVHRAN